MNNMRVFNDFEIPKKDVYSGLEFMFDAEPRFSFLWYFPEKASQYLVHPYIFNVNISFYARDISRLHKNTILSVMGGGAPEPYLVHGRETSLFTTCSACRAGLASGLQSGWYGTAGLERDYKPFANGTHSCKELDGSSKRFQIGGNEMRRKLCIAFSIDLSLGFSTDKIWMGNEMLWTPVTTGNKSKMVSPHLTALSAPECSSDIRMNSFGGTSRRLCIPQRASRSPLSHGPW